MIPEGDDAEMEFAESVLAPAAKNFMEGHEKDELPLEFFIACDVSINEFRITNDLWEAMRRFLVGLGSKNGGKSENITNS